jgi:hypothetical protein
MKIPNVLVMQLKFWYDEHIKYRIFSNLIHTSFLPSCIVHTARTPALSFGQNPPLDRESNPRSILISICIFSPLQL